MPQEEINSRIKFTEEEVSQMVELFRQKLNAATSSDDPIVGVYDVISQWIAIPRG